MREADFEVLLRLVERLGGEQRAALGRALASASGEPEAVRLLEQAFAAAPRCPHCAATTLQRWGSASGLRRYRCTACRRTFNALTGTSLARLRKKACWLRYGEALAVRPKPVAGFRERIRTPTAGSLRPLGAVRPPSEPHCREQRPCGSSSTVLLREGRQVVAAHPRGSCPLGRSRIHPVDGRWRRWLSGS